MNVAFKARMLQMSTNEAQPPPVSVTWHERCQSVRPSMQLELFRRVLGLPDNVMIDLCVYIIRVLTGCFILKIAWMHF